MSAETQYAGAQGDVSNEARASGLERTVRLANLTQQLAIPDTAIIEVLLAVRDPATMAWLRETLAPHPLVRIIGEPQDGLEAAQMARELHPTVCVIEAELPVMDGYETCELVSVAAPEVATVLVHCDDWIGGNTVAMRLGARACLSAGRDDLALLEVMTKLATIAKRRTSREFARVTDPTLMPNVIAVSAAKGGVGKTTVAVNLSVALAKRFPGETVLVDYYSQYGDAAVMLGLKPSLGISGLAREGSEIRLPAYLVAHGSGLTLLPGTDEPDGAADPLASVEFAGRLITTLRSQFRIIVLDLPPVLTPATLHLISRSNHFLVVCNFHELTTLRDTMLLVNSAANGALPGDRLKLIGNRVTPANRRLGADLERTTKRTIAHYLPEAPRLTREATDAGEPFVLTNPRAPLSLAMVQLADLVDPKEIAARLAQPSSHARRATSWRWGFGERGRRSQRPAASACSPAEAVT